MLLHVALHTTAFVHTAFAHWRALELLFEDGVAPLSPLEALSRPRLPTPVGRRVRADRETRNAGVAVEPIRCCCCCCCCPFCMGDADYRGSCQSMGEDNKAMGVFGDSGTGRCRQPSTKLCQTQLNFSFTFIVWDTPKVSENEIFLCRRPSLSWKNHFQIHFESVSSNALRGGHVKGNYRVCVKH